MAGIALNVEPKANLEPRSETKMKKKGKGEKKEKEKNAKEKTKEHWGYHCQRDEMTFTSPSQ